MLSRSAPHVSRFGLISCTIARLASPRTLLLAATWRGRSAPAPRRLGRCAAEHGGARRRRQQAYETAMQVGHTDRSADYGSAQDQRARRRRQAGGKTRTGRDKVAATRASRFRICLARRPSPHPSELSASSKFSKNLWKLVSVVCATGEALERRSHARRMALCNANGHCGRRERTRRCCAWLFVQRLSARGAELTSFNEPDAPPAAPLQKDWIACRPDVPSVDNQRLELRSGGVCGRAAKKVQF